MSGTKEYKIVINGITESVNAVDSLLKKLDTLEQRIDAINQKQATVSTESGGSGGGSSSRKAQLSEEAKLVDQINRLEEKREALEKDWGKQLADQKQALKEINAEQKSLAAMDRVEKSGILNGGDLPKTMLEMKSQLADIKAAMQTMDVESEEFLKAADRADQLNSKLKEIEQSYGTFSRNVGNYPTALMDSMGKINVQLGDQTVQFNSVREAIRTLKEEMRKAAVEGKEDTEEYKNMSQALHQVSEASKRAEDEIQAMQQSSVGLHHLMETFQSFGAIGQITNGFGSIFGDTGFEESIQKLMSLQSVMNGLKTISEQMNTGSGLGKYFSQGSKAVDTFVAKLTGAKVGMNGLEASTKTATYTVKGLSLAIKGILSLGVMLVIDKVVEGLQKLSQFFTGAKNSALETIEPIDLVSKELEEQNKILDNRKKEIDLMQDKGLISAQEAERLKIEATNETLRQQIELLGTIARLNDEDDVWENVDEGMKNFASSDDSIFNPETYEEKKKAFQSLMTAFTNGLNIYEEKIEEGNASFADHAANVMSHLGLISGTSEDVKEIFVKNTQQMVGQFIAAGRQIINHTGEWTEQEKRMFQNVLDTMNDPGFLKSVLMNLPAYLGDQAAALQPVVDSIKAQLRSIGQSLNLNVPLTTDEKAKQMSDEEKEAARLAQLRIDAIKDSGERERAQYRYNMQQELKDLKEGSEEYNLTVQKYQNKIDDTYKKGGAARVKTTKATGKQTVDIEKETQRAKLDAMADGLTKTLMKLKQERDERLKRVKGHKEAELYINQYYDKKILEETQKYQKEINEGYKQLWNSIFSYQLETTQKLLSTYESAGERIYNDTFEYNEKLWANYFDSATKAVSDDDTLKLMKPLDVFKQRIEELNDIYEQAANDSLEKMREAYRLRDELLSQQKDKELQETSDWFDEMIDKTNEYYDKLIDDTREKIKQTKDEDEKNTLQGDIDIWEQERVDKVLEIREEFYKRRDALDKEYQEKQNDLERKQFQESDRLNKDHIDRQLNEYRQFYNEIQKIADSQPTRNALGFINVPKTNKAYREVLASLEEYKTKLQEMMQALNYLRETNSITYSTWANATEELNRQLEGLDKKIKETKDGLDWKGKLQDFFQELQQYYSAVSDAFQNILGAFQETQDYIIEKQMDALDKENEALQKKLEENEKILERHKEAVDKIEGELSDARGDRKQKLIDALNAEILAQRRAQAEREKLEKEQEKLEKQQKALEEKQKRLEYERGLQQILFQTSQAIMSAAVNSWPIPAIPLMALAAATGALQYSLAKQRKPYAEGGIIDGLSHSNGGVPLSDGLEVENGEYVINKKQTERNIELLNLINNSDRQLSPADLMNFATNMSVSPLEANAPENTSLETAFAVYANRPIVVSVVDIVNKQNEVRTVQTLAGMP